MARTVLSPYYLPGDSLAGAEIIDDRPDDQTGCYASGIGINSLYRNYRGTLVFDGKVSGTAPLNNLMPVLYSSSQVAEYRPRILGWSALTERVVVRLYVNFVGSGSVRFDCAVGSGATASATISASTTGWITLLDTGANPIITDSAETETFDVDFTIVSGSWTLTRVEAVHIYYPVSSADLPAPPSGSNGYTTSGFKPLDSSQFAGERPRSSAAMHHMHEDLRYLDRKRVGNFASAGNMSDGGSTNQSSTILTAIPPPGVTSAKFWLKSVAAGTTVTIQCIGGSGASTTVGTSTAWVAQSIAVQAGVPCAFLLFTDDLATKFFRALSAYYRDI
jgi:hypothetical protein